MYVYDNLVKFFVRTAVKLATVTPCSRKKHAEECCSAQQKKIEVIQK